MQCDTVKSLNLFRVWPCADFGYLQNVVSMCVVGSNAEYDQMQSDKSTDCNLIQRVTKCRGRLYAEGDYMQRETIYPECDQIQCKLSNVK